MRSAWKIKFRDSRLERNAFSTPPPFVKEVRKKGKPSTKHTYLRHAVIHKKLIDQRVAVHCGNDFKSFVVDASLIGRKFGECITTKRLGNSIHTVKKKVKKGTKGKK
jgi:ribosomal protein S19